MAQVQHLGFVPWLDYRVAAIQSALVVLIQMDKWEAAAPSMHIHFGDVLVAQGSATGYTNPVLEAGILHGRAVLEFIGLKTNREGDVLQEARGRKHDDVCIERIDGLLRPSVADALGEHAGLPPERVENGLVYMLNVANKGLAHMTHGFIPKDGDVRILCDAFVALIDLANRYVYDPLGIARKEFVSVEARPASTSAPHASA